jgi:uncharacterized NAD(P)/FAD-binding protein YdhS
MIVRSRGEHSGERRRFARPPERSRGLGRERVVAIVGAGASGTLTAVHLLRHGGTRVVLIDPALHGLGVAYSTKDKQHLLNVPAAAMSGLADEPGDFLDWCRDRGVQAEPEDYLSRRLYGAYLQELLARFGERSRLEIVRERVENVLEPVFGGGLRLSLSGGRTLAADAVVLALGNPPPAPLQNVPAACQPVLIDDPWSSRALRMLRGAKHVAIIGSGLTSVDVALSVLSGNPEAEVSAISRHGWLPRAQLPGRPALRRTPALASGCSLEQILATVGREIAARPEAWREVIDGLRPLTTSLWQGLAPRERELRVPWEVHRHRLAPTVAARVRELIADGRLTVRSGGVGSLRPSSTGCVRLELGHGELLDADVLVNATGPSRSVSGYADPLTRGLLASGRACPDELGIGLATSADGALIDVEGEVSRCCFTLGPPRRGELLESTAIPEIRQQAAQLARLLSGTSAQRERASSAMPSNAASGFIGS